MLVGFNIFFQWTVFYVLNNLSNLSNLNVVDSVFVSQKTVEALAVILFFFSGSLLFLVIPPLLFSYVEGWTFGESFYFAFITLSTIGFGDYVVGE